MLYFIFNMEVSELKNKNLEEITVDGNRYKFKDGEEIILRKNKKVGFRYGLVFSNFVYDGLMADKERVMLRSGVGFFGNEKTHIFNLNQYNDLVISSNKTHGLIPLETFGRHKKPEDEYLKALVARYDFIN